MFRSGASGPPASKRSYEDGCAAAHALDLIGERWALLLVRELLLGPKRFTDLRADLPGISPNMLSQRLKDLEDIGVLTRQHLPPPAASWVYLLTDWGHELEPVLQTLGRWGARSPVKPASDPISLATLITAMKTMFSPAAAQDLTLELALTVGHDHFAVHVSEAGLRVERGTPQQPQVQLEADVATLGSLIFGGLALAEAEQSGTVRMGGNRELAGRFLRLFPLPEVVPTG